MEKLEILYDHYKETIGKSKEAQDRRNKSFIVLCILEAIMFLILVRPEKAFEIILNRINIELGITLQLSHTIIQTLLWIIIAYTMIRYIQDMLYIERQYIYLNKLEKSIQSLMMVNDFTRESESYLENYPMVLNFIDLFYKMLMPIFFAIINWIRIWKEWLLAKDITMMLICDTVLFGMIFVIIWFYFFEIHSKITGFLKKKVPMIEKVAEYLREVLRNV